MRERPERPTRAELEALIRQAKGNLTRLAARLDVARPTLYTWIYQHDLTSVAGIDGGYSTHRLDHANRKDTESRNNVRARKHGGRSLQIVSTATRVATDPRVNTSVRIRESIWKRMRMRAIAEGRTVAEVLERASEAYLITPSQDESKQ
jgi:hypothetical protein